DCVPKDDLGELQARLRVLDAGLRDADAFLGRRLQSLVATDHRARLLQCSSSKVTGLSRNNVLLPKLLVALIVYGLLPKIGLLDGHRGLWGFALGRNERAVR